MSKYIKMLALTFVTMAFVLPANAKVINLYDLEDYEFFGSRKLTDKKDEAAKNCKSTEITQSVKNNKNMICANTRTLKNGTKCYTDCCSKDDYPFTQDDCGTGLKGAGGTCTVNGTTRYTTCECDSSAGYSSISSSDLTKYSTYFNISSAKKEVKKNNKTITCYKIADFTCKQEYPEVSGTTSGNGIEVTLSASDEPVRYKVAQAGNKKCVYGVDGLTSSAVYTSRPSTACALTDSKTAKKFSSYIYYYNTGCSTSGNCVATSSQDCTNISSNNITVFNTSNQSTSSKTCYQVTGCKTGWAGDVLCDTYKDVTTGINRAKKGGDTTSCMSVSCASGYTTYASGVEDSSQVALKRQRAGVWHNVGVYATANTGIVPYLICAKPNCPTNATYNATEKNCACNTGYIMDEKVCHDGPTYCAEQSKLYNTVSGKCQSCASGKVFNPTTKTCRDECKANSTWNGTTCACDSGYNKDASGNCIACSGGKTWNGTACVCSAGYTEDASGNCIACSGGKTWNGTACVCNSGYTEDASGNCVKEETECSPCPANTTLVKDKCLCNVGTFIDGNNCSLERTDLIVVAHQLYATQPVMVVADLSTAVVGIDNYTPSSLNNEQSFIHCMDDNSTSTQFNAYSLSSTQYKVIQDTLGSNFLYISAHTDDAGKYCYIATDGVYEANTKTVLPYDNQDAFANTPCRYQEYYNGYNRYVYKGTHVCMVRKAGFINAQTCEEEVDNNTNSCSSGQIETAYGCRTPCEVGMYYSGNELECSYNKDTYKIIETSCSGAGITYIDESFMDPEFRAKDTVVQLVYNTAKINCGGDKYNLPDTTWARIIADEYGVSCIVVRDGIYVNGTIVTDMNLSVDDKGSSAISPCIEDDNIQAYMPCVTYKGAGCI